MSKLNIVVRLQHWMDSVPGQTFLNYAYSWGAAIVILGALFKLTHIPGGNLMLFLGMGTEAVVFFLAAFDRPFDKEEIGKELAKDFETDEEIERAEGWIENDTEHGTEHEIEYEHRHHEHRASEIETPSSPAAAHGSGVPGGSTIIIGGTSAVGSGVAPSSGEGEAAANAPAGSWQAAVANLYNTPEGTATVEQEADKLATIIRLANDELLRRAQAVLSPEMEAATQDYIGKLTTLNETLAKVDEQSARLTRDSQEMENLNRTLIGINKVYDLHFASISRQVNTIEDINAQTKDLAAKIEEVNRIYARMMQTLSIMSNPAAAMTATASAANPQSETEL